MNSRVAEKAVIEGIAAHYDVAKDFDYFNTKLASRLICPYCLDRNVVEIGSATGEMTEDLLSAAQSVTVIEPSDIYCSNLREKFGDRITIINDFIENVEKIRDADVIVMASLLHHLDDPGALIGRLRERINDHTIIIATVPNMASLHRRIGVKTGMLQDVYGTTERNSKFAQPGRFDKLSLSRIFTRNDFEIIECFGYMLKPFSSEQMMRLELGWDVINALFDLGKEYEDLSSQLFVSARPLKRA